MALPPISPAGVMPAMPTLPSTKPAATEAAGGFGEMVAKALQNVNQTQRAADGMAQAASTGTAADVHEYMIAATQANLATELTVAVRNKAVEAFNDIMRMQI